MKKPRKVFNVFISVCFGLLLVAPFVPFFSAFLPKVFSSSNNDIVPSFLIDDAIDNQLFSYYFEMMSTQVVSSFSWFRPFNRLFTNLRDYLSQWNPSFNSFTIAYLVYCLYISFFYISTKFVVSVPMLFDKLLERLGV